MAATTIAIAPVSNKMLWAGRIVSTLPVLMLVISGIMKLVLVATANPGMAEGFTGLGWDPRYALALAILELGSAIVYVIPRTAVLGAILAIPTAAILSVVVEEFAAERTEPMS